MGGPKAEKCKNDTGKTENMRKIRFIQKEFYHLYNRGVDKRVIFSGKEEYDRFVAYLYLANDQKSIRPSDLVGHRPLDEILLSPRRAPLVAVGAYCLMPNHFHILATQVEDVGISKFMHRLQTAYTMYFNGKHQRVGRLLEGTFKARHIESDDHLKFIFSYIHLNPAKLFSEAWKRASAPELATLSLRVSEYKYSSIGEYMAEKFRIISPKQYPKYFSGARDMKKIMDFWLRYKRDFSNE